jgi:hypothetical protein
MGAKFQESVSVMKFRKSVPFQPAVMAMVALVERFLTHRSLTTDTPLD